MFRAVGTVLGRVHRWDMLLECDSTRLDAFRFPRQTVQGREHVVLGNFLIHSSEIYLVNQDTEPTETPRLSPRGYLRKSIITGTAIVFPVLITAAVVLFIVNFLSQLLNPLVVPIRWDQGTYRQFCQSS